MLDDKIINVLVDRLVSRIEQGNEYILKQMGNTIKHIGTLSPSKANQLVNILKYGGNYDKIVRKLAQITELNIRDIEKIFEAVAKENLYFAKQFYEYRNIKYIPYEKNISLQRQVKALARITANNYMNISRTLAFTKIENGKVIYTDLARTYQNMIDEAVLNISQGKTDFNSNMYKTIKELGQSGIKTVDYASGYSRRLDSAVRQNIQSALRDMSNELQKQFGEEFDYDGIEVSHHANPAPDHEFIDGEQFSKEKFEKINSELERPVGELNCYHYIFPIILGVSKPNYTKEQLQADKEKNKKGFNYEGKHYTLYEGTQLQRKIETEIRKAKDTQIIAKASGNKELVQESQSKITQLTYKYKELSKISGLPTQLERARVSGYKRTNVNKM
jgi:hypothetical protein